MTAPTGTPGAPTDGGTPTGPAPATGTQQQSTPPAPAAPETQDVSQLPAFAQKIIKDARDEAAKHRTDKQAAVQATAAEQAKLTAVLKALGLKADGTEDTDPSKLTEQVAQYQAVAWENAVKFDVFRMAPALGFDADTLLDSNSFLNTLEDLVDEDPSGGEFRTKLEKHVKDFVAKNPKFKATSAGTPARSGGDMPPGQPGTPRDRPKSLMDAVSRHFKAG